MPTSRLASEHRKVGAGTQASFQLCRLPIRPRVWSGPTDTGLVAKPTRKDTEAHLPTSLLGKGADVLDRPFNSHRKTSSSGQSTHEAHKWHLKSNWRIPESLEKRIPLPRSLHPHLQWWLEEDNVLTGQPLHPMQHALQIFTDASKEGWGAHLNEFIARGTWSLPESKLHINYLELKAVFLALKEFQKLCMGKMVLVATDNTTVVAYINKEGGMRSGPLCPLLWRIFTCSTGKQVTLKARHIPGRLNVVADKLSRSGQTIQTEWSLLPEVFQALCNRWHQPQIDLFATRFNNKLPLFVSPVPDPMATAVDALSLSSEDLDAYAFPPTAKLGKVVEKLQDSPYQRLIIIVPGWPNMTWFWDLVEMSSQIPLFLPQLPNLLTQPFNQTPHRSLTNLNLHGWLLEPQLSRSRVSLRRWQQELRLLKEAQPDPSMRQSGPFLQSGASQFRWTSGAPPVNSVADFLMYLFEERKLQPSTIDGYRSAIGDKLGNSTLSISKDENLTRLLNSFHRDRPKGRRGIPSWNLSLVLHQLTKAPFEPIKEASLKHLTFKTVFLLALGSGKRRSEIHAWQSKNIRHQSDWSKYLCTHLPAFFPRTSWLRRVRTVWPQWLYQPWPRLCIGPSSLTGPSVRSELCATTWTGPQTSGRIRSWFLSPSRKVLTRTSHLPRSPHGLNRL